MKLVSVRRLVACAAMVPLIVGLTQVHVGAETPRRRAELRVIANVNKFRVAKGLTALVENSVIQTEARRHSRYMADQHKLSHDNLDERKAAIIAGDDGITNPDKICENTGRASLTSPGAVAKSIVKAWRKVGSLKRCMIDRAGFTAQSVGVGIHHDGQTWWVTFLAAHDTTT